jgi:SpoVK/Ycf46/Vps4 family AAA+-type ATPase
MPLLRLDVGRVFGRYIGESEAGIRSAIRTAEAIAPAVLWIDEIEKGFAGSVTAAHDTGVSARVLGTFLTWLQEKTKPVFVVGTSNNIEQLPPELLRKGRFDEIFFVDLPSLEERREIFEIHLRKRKRDPTAFDLDAMARESAGFSGAEIEQAIIAGLFDAFDAGRELTTEDILRTIRQSVPLSRTMKEQIQTLREWADTRARPASSTEVEPIEALTQAPIPPDLDDETEAPERLVLPGELAPR